MTDQPEAGRPVTYTPLRFRIVAAEGELAVLLKREQARAIKEVLQWASTHQQPHRSRSARSPSEPEEADDRG